MSRPLRTFVIVHANGQEHGVVTGRAPAAAACKAGSARMSEKGGNKTHVRLRERGATRGKGTFEYDVTRSRKKSAVRTRNASFRYDIQAHSLNRARSRSARRSQSVRPKRARTRRPRRW